MLFRSSIECGVKAMVAGAENNIQEYFFDWLAEEVPPEQRLNLYSILNSVCTDIESFCIQYGFLASPLFDTVDLNVIEKVKNTVETDELFHSTCKYGVDKAISAINLYCQFLEEQSIVLPSVRQAELSKPLQQLLSGDNMQQLREELLKQHILTLEQFKKINSWGFMNRYALYSISQRQDVYKCIQERLKLISEQQCISAEKSSVETLQAKTSEATVIQQAEKIALDSDLKGITIDALCEKMNMSRSAVKRVVADSQHIILLGDKLFHDNAFVDWEDGANQMEQILDKLLNKNGGYVSAAQLYEYARAGMQMFLNDNGIDDYYMVYDFAQHLFEKINYHGKHLSFQSKSHISRSTLAIASNFDVIQNYARSQDGFFREDDLIIYLQSVGVKTGNLRGQMKVYDKPTFLFYDIRTYMTAERIGIDAGWLEQVRKALDNLFADMGDHIVLRDIQSWWYTQLPSLPSGKDWTALLLQSVLKFYGNILGGAHTISGLNTQTGDTLHAMLVSGSSEIQTFADAVIAFLIDEGITERRFEAEELRQMLVQRGMVAGNELVGNMPKALAKDGRFAWDADEQFVTIRM